MKLSTYYNLHDVHVNVADMIHNDNGSDYIIVGINLEKDRILLIPKEPRVTLIPQYIVCVGLRCLKNGKYCWGHGHYFLDDLSGATKFLYGLEDEA